MKNFLATLLLLTLMVAPLSSYSINATNLTEITKSRETVKKPDLFALPFCYYHTTKKLTINPDGSTIYESSTTLICTVIIVP